MSGIRPITVVHEEGFRSTVVIGRHHLTVDQPPDAGGEDGGPTPTELFVGSIAACMEYFAVSFLRGNGIDVSGLVLSVSAEMSRHPSRVGVVRVDIAVPCVPDRLIAPLHRAVERCTVHNSLLTPPTIDIRIERERDGCGA